MKLEEVRAIHKKTGQRYTKGHHNPWMFDKNGLIQRIDEYGDTDHYPIDLDDLDDDDWKLEPLPEEEIKVGDRVVIGGAYAGTGTVTEVGSHPFPFKFYRVCLDNSFGDEIVFNEQWVKKLPKEKSQDEEDLEFINAFATAIIDSPSKDVRTTLNAAKRFAQIIKRKLFEEKA